MNDRRQQVLFDGEPAIRRLHPIGPSYARHLAREALLAGGISHMFDDGVTEDDVERLSRKGQRPAVAGDPGSGAAQIVLRPRRIQQRDARTLRDQLPTIGRASDVENARSRAVIGNSRRNRRIRRRRK